MTMSDQQGSRPSQVRWLAAAAVVVLVLLMVWLASRGGGNADAPAAQQSGGSPSPTTTAATDPSQSMSSTPTKSPGQTEPTEVVKTGKSAGRVKASLDTPADLGNGISVEVTKIESVQGKGRGPGETSGPSLRFTLRIENDSSQALDLNSAVVTSYYGPQNTPASDLAAPGVENFPTVLKAGGSTDGRFVFRIPLAERDQVRVDFGFSSDVPVAVFSGAA
jgi:hypothetical protein